MVSFKRQTYSGQVVEFIKTSILRGELSPGEQVKEVVLAERLGISRAPIREALQILTQDGLITAEPQKGKHIRVMSAQEIRDNYEIGGVLEGAAIALSLHLMTDDDIARVGLSLNKMERLARAARGLADLTEIDEEFHDAVLACCTNRQLVNMARSACVNISKFLFYNHWDKAFTPEEFFRRHQAIFQAIQTRDSQRIEHTLREHYRESGKRMACFGAPDPHSPY